jgi:hypothetical protein
MAKSDVAETIKRQLGGHRFVLMTGAYALLYSEHSLSFSLPRRPGNKCNKVDICLARDDTYVVTFFHYNARKLDLQVLHKATGVHVEQLCQLFEEHTKLRLSL